MSCFAARSRRSAVALAMAAALALAAPAPAETWECSFFDAGLVKGDLGVLYTVSGTAAAPPGGWTLTEIDTTGVWTTYSIAGWPDPAAGDTTLYKVTLEDPSGLLCRYWWPDDAVPAQNLVWSPSYSLGPGSNRIKKGDTLPAILLDVTGLAANPAGSTVTATIYRLGTGAVTTLAAEPASLVTSSSYVATPSGVTAWRGQLKYSWAVGDTTALGVGEFFVQFLITFPVSDCGPDEDEACTLTVPSERQAPLWIVP